jgi:TRAP-type C4-dicarboxylate transport system permease large subunit
VASVLMVSSSIAKCSVWDTTRVNIYFIAVLFTVLMLVTYVPVTGMGLVNYFYN